MSSDSIANLGSMPKRRVVTRSDVNAFDLVLVTFGKLGF